MSEEYRDPGAPRRSLRITRHAPDPERDVRDELELHIDLRTEELIAQGVAPDDARRQARAAFGNHDAIARTTRSLAAGDAVRRRRTELLGSLVCDARLALRGLVREPGFALVAIVTLALCLGANAAVFAVINTVVLRPLPFPNADRLVTFFNAYPGSGIERTDNSVPDWYDRSERMAALESAALYDEVSVTIGEGAASANVFASHVSPPFFEVLGVQPALGRAFSPDDGIVGRNDGVVISHGFWQSRFAGADDVIGRTLEIENRVYTVIGVMPEGFEFVTWDAQIWFSFAWPESMRDAYHRNNYGMIGRLAPGATVQQAQQQLDALNEEIAASYGPENRRALDAAGFRSVVRGWQDDLVRDFRAPLYLLWASVALVLAIGAFNVANLLLLRLGARMRELSTRFVLGASRWRIARQLFTETLVLTALGAALGSILAAWSLRFLGIFEHYQVPRLSEVRPDLPPLAFTFAAAIGIATLAVLLPVATVRRGDLFGFFRGAGVLSGASTGGRLPSMRDLLVAGQVAAAFMLVSTGGLLLASLMNLWAVDPGFDTGALSAGGVLLTADRHPTPADRAEFRRRAVQELAALPGVSAAAMATQLPFSGQESRIVFFPEGYRHAADEAIEAHYYTGVTPGYFEALEIPLLAGRLFDEADDAAAMPVMIVDRRLAERYWPGESPIGRRVAFDTRPDSEDEWLTVVGVVGDVVQNDLADPIPGGAFYLPDAQSGEVMWRWIVRGPEPAVAHEQARAAFRRLDPEMPVFWTTTMEGAIAERLIPRRIPMLLVAGFAGLALLLTTLGVYGVLGYVAARRTREFGIRLALGGSVTSIFRLMLERAALLIGVGIAAGAAGAIVLGRLIAGQLYEVQPTDPWALGGAAALITAVALIAGLSPTRRATRVDPMVALRQH